MEESRTRRLKGAAAIVMTSIILSRVTGFIREMLIPNKLGVDHVGDSYNIAFLIPDLMYNMLVGGAIAAALIPVLAGYLEQGREEDGWKAVGTFINTVIIAMIFVCGLGMIFTSQLIHLVATGFGSNKPLEMALTIKLTRILLPSVTFIMLAGLCNGVLNSYHRFAASAYGPAVYNIGSALSLMFLSKYGVEAVAYGVMASSIIYFLFQLTFTLKNLKHYKFKFFARHPGTRRLFDIALPSLISSSIVQVNLIISQRFITFFAAGSVTAFKMADRTWQMPYGIFAQGIGIAILPTLSARLAVGDTENYKKILMKSLKTVLLLSIPAAVGFIVLAEPMIRTIFKFSSKVNEDDVLLSANILMFFSLALLSQSIVTILNRAFYARNNTKTPLYIGASTIVINIALSYVFKTIFGVSGMALSYSIASLVNAILLLVILDIQMKGIYLDKLMIFLAKVIPASVIMGVILYLCNTFLTVHSGVKYIQLLFLLIEIALGAGVYIVAALAFEVEEAREIYGSVTGKLKQLTAKFK